MKAGRTQAEDAHDRRGRVHARRVHASNNGTSAASNPTRPRPSASREDVAGVGRGAPPRPDPEKETQHLGEEILRQARDQKEGFVVLWGGGPRKVRRDTESKEKILHLHCTIREVSSRGIQINTNNDNNYNNEIIRTNRPGDLLNL